MYHGSIDLSNSALRPTDSVSSVNPDSQGNDCVVVGVDIGGTKISAGLADLNGKVLAMIERATAHGEGAPFLPQIDAMVAALCAEAGVDRSRIVRAVVGVPGAVNPTSGQVSLSPNLAFPSHRPAADFLSELLMFPVDVENDVNIAAYGEAMSNQDGTRGVLVFASFGTGVGLGLVAGGTILRGVNGRAGEIAYLPIGTDPHKRATSVMKGLYEEAVGSVAIATHYGSKGITVAEIFDRAAKSDAKALKVIDDVARIASVGLAAVQSLLDPVALVIGGSIGVRTEFFDAIRRHMSMLLPYPANLQVSSLGRNAGVLGAVLAAARAAREGSTAFAWNVA